MQALVLVLLEHFYVLTFETCHRLQSLEHRVDTGNTKSITIKFIYYYHLLTLIP